MPAIHPESPSQPLHGAEPTARPYMGLCPPYSPRQGGLGTFPFTPPHAGPPLATRRNTLFCTFCEDTALMCEEQEARCQDFYTYSALNASQLCG